jgi:hypothetical protein
MTSEYGELCKRGGQAMTSYEPCMCGATDCPSCGPAQGYSVIKRYNSRGGYSWVNPEDDEEEEEQSDPPDPDPYYED